MTANEFEIMVRAGAGAVLVPEATLVTPAATLNGCGMLSFKPGEIRFLFAWKDGELPRPDSHVYRDKFWRLSGVFPNATEFVAHDVPPSWDLPGVGNWRSCELRLQTVDFQSSGFSARTYDEMEAACPIVSGQADLTGTPAETRRSRVPPERRVQGRSATVFPNLKLDYFRDCITVTMDHPFLGKRSKHEGRGFRGEVGNYHYGVYEDGTDVHVFVHSKQGITTTSKEDDRFRESVLHAFAFIQGVECAPICVQKWRDGKLELHQLRALCPGVRTDFVPFLPSYFLTPPQGDGDSGFVPTFELVLRFFLEGGEIQKEIGVYLRELRLAATPGMPPEHSVLAVCRVFEGVIKSLFAAIQSGEQKKPAKPIKLEHKYEALLNKYGLQTPADAHCVFDSKVWSLIRNALAHGELREDRKLLEDEIDAGKIAGAINMLVLSRAGYVGKFLASAHERKYGFMFRPSALGT